ncbi:unnamed protein product [Amaranthus hypochondriacus]
MLVRCFVREHGILFFVVTACYRGCCLFFVAFVLALSQLSRGSLAVYFFVMSLLFDCEIIVAAVSFFVMLSVHIKSLHSNCLSRRFCLCHCRRHYVVAVVSFSVLLSLQMMLLHSNFYSVASTCAIVVVIVRASLRLPRYSFCFTCSALSG